MTNYVKSTNFTSKDSLASGNPLKIIKGTEFDVEFNNIAVAVATKADIISPTFSGTPAAPTATAGTNTTQLATTAFTAAATTAERTATATLTNKTINLTSNTVTGTKAQFNAACSDADFATLAGTETLTGKTVDMTNNTVTGTKAQFNTSCSDTDFSFLNDFTGTNQSKTANGYQKLPGGLIVQWGSTTSQGGSTTAPSLSDSFPIAFPTACVSFQATPYGGTLTADGDWMVTFNSTQFGAKHRISTHTYTWLAFGY